MTTHRPIAHAAQHPDGSWREPHDLTEHLIGVAELAAEFAASYGPSWARLAGQWHDLGKYRPRFQNYIRKVSGFEFEADAHISGEAGKAPHSTAGAVRACDRFGIPGRVLAYLVAGHHAGLADWFGGLRERLNQPAARDELDEALATQPPQHILDAGNFTPDLSEIPGGKAGFALWVRMLFSALVDADFLDTEAYMDADKAARRVSWPALTDLSVRFDAHMNKFKEEADPTPVNVIRADILRQCRAASALQPGLFSLTVPTGGGKTLSGMAFALDHARRYGKRRIIHVIPYTSIIEQTADIFQRIFGGAVIEHHSNVESDPNQETAASRLACENWDAPIIVTTNVQFFESLFAARTSRCRKLHNLVDSVVILDEAQLLPPEFLQPILDVLNLLSRHYGVTVVLATATQPALSTTAYFDARRSMNGLDDVREIIEEPDSLYASLERVRVRLPADHNATVTWDALAQKLGVHDSVLAVVNTRKHARDLWREMPQGTLHLSALMCGAHRSQLIGEIKQRLADAVPTRVISTQLVEAGVDVDFPVVYRAMAGLDSIAQASGRCNREGRLAQGEVVVFNPPSRSPPGHLRKAEDASRAVLGNSEEPVLARERFSEYFRRLYYASDLDAKGIVRMLTVGGRDLDVEFRKAADAFRLIDDEDSVPIVVRYRCPDSADDMDLLKILRRDGPKRWLMRKLQRYTVNLHRRQAEALIAQGDIEELVPGLYGQISDWLYDPVLGLNPDGAPATPSATIC